MRNLLLALCLFAFGAVGWATDARESKLTPVLSLDGHQVWMVDTDRFVIAHRMASPFELEGALQFSPDGHYAYAASPQGWIVKFDLWSLSVVATAWIGSGLPSLAVSGDGSWVMAASAEAPALNLLDASLRLVRSYDVRAADGKQTSRIATLHVAPARKSFFVALKDSPEIWEISYDRNAEPVYEGLVHDYRMGEAIPKPGFLGVKRTILDESLEDIFFFVDGRHALGRARSNVAGSSQLHVINLDIRRRISIVALPGLASPGSAVSFAQAGTAMLAIPDRQAGLVNVVEVKSWKFLKTIETVARGIVLRSHENADHLWIASRQVAPDRAGLILIDKKTLAVVAPVSELQYPLMRIVFTRDGQRVLASQQDITAPWMVYQTRTVVELGRVPMDASPEGVR